MNTGAVSWSASPSGASGACTGTDSFSCVVDVDPDAVGLRLRTDVLADREARLLPVPGETSTERALRSLRGSLSVLEARRKKQR